MADHPLTVLFDRWATPPAHLVGKLPRAGVQLDYLGHAAVTKALLETDPAWSWEPVAWTEHGTPYIGHQGNRLVMWIRLTVCEVDRLGVGTCRDDKQDPEKELIGDALRNAAMRFGVGLSLWAKEEWHTEPKVVGAGEGGFSVDVSQDVQPEPVPTQSGSGVDNAGARSGGPTPDPVIVTDEERTARATLRGTVKASIEQLDDGQKKHLRSYMRKKHWALANLDSDDLTLLLSYVNAMVVPDENQLTIAAPPEPE